MNDKTPASAGPLSVLGGVLRTLLWPAFVTVVLLAYDDDLRTFLRGAGTSAPAAAVATGPSVLSLADLKLALNARLARQLPDDLRAPLAQLDRQAAAFLFDNAGRTRAFNEETENAARFLAVAERLEASALVSVKRDAQVGEQTWDYVVEPTELGQRAYLLLKQVMVETLLSV